MTAPVHYLRKNESVWTPPTIICFDTETVSAESDGAEVHSIRLWCATISDRRPPGGRQPHSESASGITGEELAHQFHRWSRTRRTIWCYAHNLHFDLCVSDLIAHLTALRWKVTDFAVDGAVPFVRLARGDHRLVIADSWSWLPAPLARVAASLGMAKTDLPDQGDSYAAWLERCQVDTDILTAAMLGLMSWWDAGQLGRWSITGGTSGWNAMRHIPTHRRIVIDPDPVKVAADRRAIYGGRRGMWHTGTMPPSRYTELDLERAYTTVCRDLPLPVERLFTFDSLPLGHRWLSCERYGVIARVRIRTDRGRWPVRIGRRVWYPAGEFWTTLAGPDIAEAARLGCLAEVGPGEVHKLGYSLRPWAMWCLAAQADVSGDVPAVAKIALKHWGRTVVGKWAQRGYTRTELGAAPTTGWGFQEGWHHNADVKASIVDFGGTRWQVSASAESDNTYPAILAFVESWVRVSLGRVIAVIGDEHLVSCDTDGVLTGPLSPRLKSAAVAAAEPFTLREKASYRQIVAIGPQHAVLDGQRRFAGVPASAAELPGGALEARLWPKLAWQMRHGRAGVYTRPTQEYHITGTYAPGWALTTGAVRPPETTITDDGATAVTPWPETRWARAGDRLGPSQNPALRRYADGQDQAGDRAHPLPRAPHRRHHREPALGHSRPVMPCVHARQR